MKLKEKIVSENNHSIHSDMNTNDLNFLYVKTNPTPTVSSAILSGMGINPSCYVSDVNGNPVLDANNLLQENKSCVFESTQKMDVDSQGQTTEISGHIDINMIDFLNGIMQMIPYQAGADADNAVIANTLATNADFQGSVADNKKLKTAVKNRLAADTDFQTAVKGEKGDNGADGARGPTGPRGPQGLKGDTGSIANLNQAVNDELLAILPDSGVVFYGDSVKLGSVSGTIELDSTLFKLELGDEFVNSIESMSFDGAYTSHFLAI